MRAFRLDPAALQPTATRLPAGPPRVGMPKRRSNEQLERAWAARRTRPNLETEPYKSNVEAKRAAQDEWVASWGGAALAAEARRKDWWKQSTKQHGELCAAYESRNKENGWTETDLAGLASAVPLVTTPSVAAPLVAASSVAASSGSASSVAELPAAARPVAVPPVAAQPFAEPPVAVPVSAAPPVAFPPIAVPLLVAPPVTPLAAAPYVATASCATLSVAAPPVAAPPIQQTAAAITPASGDAKPLAGALETAPPATAALLHARPPGPAPKVDTDEERGVECEWDCAEGVWRRPDDRSVHEVERHKKRKLDAAAKRALCERIDSDIHHDAAAAANDATAAATAAKFFAEAAASRAAEEAVLAKPACERIEGEWLALNAATHAAYLAARHAAPTRVELMKLNLCELDASFRPLLCQVSSEQQETLRTYDASFRSQLDALWSSWATELRTALESAVPGCKVQPMMINCGTKELEGSVTSTLIIWRRGNYWEEMQHRLEVEGSSLSCAEVEGTLRQVMEAKVRTVATQLLVRKLAVDREIAERAHASQEARRAEARAAEAERVRKRDEFHERLMLQIREHGACAQCGYDGAGEDPYRRALSIWEGRCRHGFWPTPYTCYENYEHSHERYCCDHERVLHSGYQRFRCTQCGWEVPNFLCAEPEPQSAVPLSSQLPLGEVHVAPLLAVGYPEPSYWIDSRGQRRLDMCTGAQGKSEPIVHVRLRVFTSAAQAPT